eukprot:CAMPEP_0205998548 /NCGR_PEP_ID=MMETSP1464-20131121/313_1 /ASSEMBLY_ACC=CAM_ASM_001124 /TAXON_ID=119497 /ORGANISM="Exanthemachrysis gayraliae, Strain RCC1523" /LENGTH=116 /DNA_ID=CAMNT_0053371699 /DNA_START=20 /DNA_END=370 /DNA_ORIENTATION=+
MASKREAEEAAKQEILRRKQHGVPIGTALLRSRMVWVYTALIAVPTFLAFAFTGGRTELSKEELMNTDAYKRLRHGKLALANKEDRAERVGKINEVLFETKGEFRHQWARKREGEK